MYIQSTVAFTRTGIGMTPLVSQKWRFLGFISEILRVTNLSLRGKVHFFQSLGRTGISRIFRLSVKIHVVLHVNFPEQFNYSFYFKYLRGYTAL